MTEVWLLQGGQSLRLAPFCFCKLVCGCETISFTYKMYVVSIIVVLRFHLSELKTHLVRVQLDKKAKQVLSFHFQLPFSIQAMTCQ